MVTLTNIIIPRLETTIFVGDTITISYTNGDTCTDVVEKIEECAQTTCGRRSKGCAAAVLYGKDRNIYGHCLNANLISVKFSRREPQVINKIVVV